MKRAWILIAASAASVMGCGDDPAGTSAVAIEFAAMVGEEPFVCGDTYDNLGADDASLQLSDFRFFVQDIELRTQAGDYVAVELTESVWQVDGNVALLDFEDCGEAGDPATNSVLTGTVASGAEEVYTGIRFAMGVPFELNHQNPATADPPLNRTSMQWDWQGGYKFLRIDSGSFSPADWRVHLGSTGCDGDPVSGGTTSCSAPNRVEVELDGFDPATDVVVADFAALVEDATLGENQEGTPFGCMAGAADTDCGPLFDNLGLPFGGSDPSGPQRFFSAE